MADQCRFNRLFSKHDFRFLNARSQCAYFYQRDSCFDFIDTRSRPLVRGLSDRFVVSDSAFGAGSLFHRRKTLWTTSDHFIERELAILRTQFEDKPGF